MTDSQTPATEAEYYAAFAAQDREPRDPLRYDLADDDVVQAAYKRGLADALTQCDKCGSRDRWLHHLNCGYYYGGAYLHAGQVSR